ncbi:Hypothetical protein D9617_8g049900 [Elsinoe fawcettii]|nr:Hypothetical protein D9617_8g049900 [Elsinoe fawcettii]
MDTDGMIHKSDSSRLSDIEKALARLEEEEVALQSQLDKNRAEQQRVKLQKIEFLDQMFMKAKRDFGTSSAASPYTTNAFTTPATSRQSRHPMDSPAHSPDRIVVATAKDTTRHSTNHADYPSEQEGYDYRSPAETDFIYHETPGDYFEQRLSSSSPLDGVGASVTLKTTSPALSRSDSALGKRKRAAPRRATMPDIPSSPGYRPHHSNPIVADELRRSHRQSGLGVIRDPSALPDGNLDLFDERLYRYKLKQYGIFKTVMIDENGDGWDLHCPACYGNRKVDGSLFSGLRGVKLHVAQNHPDRFDIKGAGEKDLLNLFLRRKIAKAELARLRAADDDEDGQQQRRQVSDGRDVIVFQERDIGKDDAWGIWVDGKKVPREVNSMHEDEEDQGHADTEAGAEPFQVASPEL